MLLIRYLLRNNLFLLFTMLLVGTGLYILTDFFERLDNFLDASFGFMNILWFYAIKVPLIVGQILPAVFLISIIVQLCLMAKARELVALQSGGISPFFFLKAILVYALLWAVAQLFLAQFLGVAGDRLSTKIWREDVKGNPTQDTEIKGLWFVDGAYVVHLGFLNPVLETGSDFLAYELTSNGKDLKSMIRGEHFEVKNEKWHLYKATVVSSENFGYEVLPEMQMPLTQKLSAFLALDPSIKPTHLPVWSLRDAIHNLERSGSNVEVLETTYYSRFAYAASLVVMGVLALAIVLWQNNVYLAVGLGLLATFLFYASTTLFVSLGEKGALSPLLASWFPTSLFLGLSIIFIFAKISPRLKR